MSSASAAIAIALLCAGFAVAGQVGDLTPEKTIPAGSCAYVTPPKEQRDGKEVVVISAPRERWIVAGKMFPVCADCRNHRMLQKSTANLALLKVRLDVSIESLRDPVRRRKIDQLTSAGMDSADAMEKVVNEQIAYLITEKLQAEHAICEESDGGPRFRVQREIEHDRDADYLR